MLIALPFTSLVGSFSRKRLKGNNIFSRLLTSNHDDFVQSAKPPHRAFSQIGGI
jgi:hypothetical protein